MVKIVLIFGEIMKEELIHRLTTWSPEQTDQFYKINEINEIYNREIYLWETIDTGVFLWHYKSSFFIQSDGKVYKISKKYTANDWKFYNDFYEMAIINDIRMEKPVYGEEIIIGDEALMYTEVQYPNYEIGNGMNHAVLNKLATTDYFIEYVYNAGVLLRNLKKLNMKYNCGYPLHIPKYANDSIGVFWYDFKYWDKNPSRIATYKKKLYNKIYMFESNYNVIVNKKKIFDLVNSEWDMWNYTP